MRKLFFLPAFAFGCCLNVAAQNGYDQLKLSEFYKKQDYDGAIHLLKSVESANENRASFNADLGYSFFMNEQYNEAIACFRKALRIDSANFESTLYMAQIWSAKDNADSSLFYYYRLTKNYPGNFRFWQKAGGLNYQLNRYDSAMICYQQAYSLNNKSGRIAIALSILLMRNKQINSADSLISEFLQRDSADEDVIARQIEISFKKSAYDTVIHWGEKLWRDSSKLSAPFVSLAYSYLNKQSYDSCLRLCYWTELTNKSNEAILYCEALAFAKLKLYEKSNEKLDECIRLRIQDEAHTYLQMKADNYENMRLFPKAVQYYDTAWYIFHKPFNLYFAGRLYDKYLNNSSKARYYYRLFYQNKPVAKNAAETSVLNYVENYLREKQKPVKR
ncbi:MAG: tetratricopeptide repeat protein [Chitinophagaceae bacterium]